MASRTGRWHRAAALLALAGVLAAQTSQPTSRPGPQDPAPSAEQDATLTTIEGLIREAYQLTGAGDRTAAREKVGAAWPHVTAAGVEASLSERVERDLAASSAWGQSMASLRQAFHAAGARYVLATLWNIDDFDAQQLMSDFYTRLWKHGEDPHRALRAAKAAARENGMPFRDWAGWVLTGM